MNFTAILAVGAMRPVTVASDRKRANKRANATLGILASQMVIDLDLSMDV